MNKTLQKTLFFVFIFCLSVNIYAEKQTFEGKVVPLVVETISSGTDAYFYGTVEKVSRLGSIVYPPITDMDGKVVNKGTVVIQQGTEYWKDIVVSNEAALKASEENLKTATENYKRFKALSPIGATSIQDFQEYEKEYYNALGELKQDKAALELSKRVLETRTQYAPFEGIVSKVLYIMGRAAGNPQTVELTQLNPIGVKIKMPRDMANQIDSSIPVTVVSLDNSKKFGVFNGASILVDDGIIFVVENLPEDCNTGKTTITSDNWFPAEYFYFDNSQNKSLCVSETSLFLDDDGYYVWKAKNCKLVMPGQGIGPNIEFEKVRVVPGDLERLYAGFEKVRILNKAASLSIGDLILRIVPESLKEGEEVTFLPKRYIFMPYETVKVIIGE